MSVAAFDIVVPTIGRPSLARLLGSIEAADGPAPGRVVVVDDRRRSAGALPIAPATSLAPIVVRTGGRGPAAARNAGWRWCTAPWVAFLDDDVVVQEGWLRELAVDLAAAAPRVGAVQGRIVVPRHIHHRLTDAERNVVALERAAFVTADMAVRREALAASGGFDERFRRAYREDTEFALRLLGAGYQIATGSRTVEHQLRTGGVLTSIRAQRGNADDALVGRIHGPAWRQHGRAPQGDLAAHRRTVAWLGASLLLRMTGRRRAAVLTGAVAALRIARLGWRRAVAGPPHAGEWARMAASSAVIPVAATWWWLVGALRARALAPHGRADQWRPSPLALVLFDRDGTLVEDVAYNGDPAAVRPVEGAREALDRLRAAGLAVGLVTNQSGIARGLIGRSQVDRVNDRVAELLGPFTSVEICPHSPTHGCACRKPMPGMVLAAAAAAGVRPDACAVVGDIGADVEAGIAAGARAILVPNAATREEEIAAAPECAPTIGAAVDLLLSWAAPAGAETGA